MEPPRSLERDAIGEGDEVSLEAAIAKAGMKTRLHSSSSLGKRESWRGIQEVLVGKVNCHNRRPAISRRKQEPQNVTLLKCRPIRNLDQLASFCREMFSEYASLNKFGGESGSKCILLLTKVVSSFVPCSRSLSRLSGAQYWALWKSPFILSRNCGQQRGG